MAHNYRNDLSQRVFPTGKRPPSPLKKEPFGWVARPARFLVKPKISGKTNEIAGKAKQAVGKATGDDALRGEGAVQEAKGKVQVATGTAKDKLKDAVDEF
jgi:uncharacterized protein YjbJ (UPF0337 family)